MDEKPKRRAWFQLHLSTCVVMMVVAGGAIWINIVPYPLGYMQSANLPPLDYPVPGMAVQRGWPSTYYQQASDPTRSGQWDWVNLALDAFTGIAVIITATIPYEYLLRRRARKPQDPTP